MMEEKPAPIIVIKKKGGHGGHHGGAWKVAYADFVTAMMAFFMVMWLMNSSQKIQEAVGSYFRDPSGTGKLQGSSMSGAGQGLELKEEDLSKLKDEISQAMQQMPEFEQLKDQVAMTVTGEGLRIELLETEKGLFFASGDMNPSGQGVEMLSLLARQLGQLPNQILIEGHTDAKPFSSSNGYSNWELSVDRANAARKLMESDGLRPGQVTQVRGFADRKLRVADEPESASNRRISVIVRYLDPPKPDPDAEPAPQEEKPAAGGHH
ncbi:MAG: flagellar motor protein MotB [Bryobacteraceae bacterium]